MTTEELNESRLGTKEYWENHYDMELSNFNEFGEKGEVWFGEDSADKMVDWVIDNVEKTKFIGDLGCGNGHLVFALEEAGFQNLVGLDYSEKSIQLCKDINSDTRVEFKVLDILKSEEYEKFEKFNVLLDKGTFDAISLATTESEKTPANQYVDAVYDMLSEDGILVLTSCNWTEPELLKRFECKFRLQSRIPYPKFQFGGVQGQTITTIILEKLFK